jgi:inositol-phosphate phosphatase/L-galactose 1-phosphate phosphatase/histidinol-phosphatase
MNQEFLEFSNKLADLARTVARKSFRSNIYFNKKKDASAVSNVDYEIESILFEMIAKNYPKHGFIGEELHLVKSRSQYTWVVDPIDGTSSFISGKPTFCTLISLLFQGRPILGIIDQPITDERWHGQKGFPTTFNSKICTSNQCNTSFIRLACTTPSMFNRDEYLYFEKAIKVSDSITFGGDAYNYGSLSLGHIDVVMEAGLKIYDAASLIPIVEGAGGYLTDWKGRAIDLDTFDGRVLATSNKVVLEKIVKQLNFKES